MQVWPGQAYPLGATYDGAGTNFAVFSEVAERIELCLLHDDGSETAIELREADAFVRHAYIPGVMPGQRYGFRVHGPGDPGRGLACDPAKLLLDPAARRVTGEVRWTPELVAPGVDSAPFVPRSVVVTPGRPIDPATKPGTPWDRTVVYEAHVGHLTARHPLVPADDRGRYRGLAAPAVLEPYSAVSPHSTNASAPSSVRQVIALVVVEGDTDRSEMTGATRSSS